MEGVPFRKVRLGPRDTEIRSLPKGGHQLRSPHPLEPYPQRLTERLLHWADRAPQRTFIAQRRADGAWRTLDYATTLDLVRRIAQALLERKLSPERPLVILSENGIEHALLALAAMHVGVPYAPISPAYSLVSTDFARLRHIIELLSPGLVFAASGRAYERALEAVVPRATEIVVVDAPPAHRPATSFGDLTGATPTAAVDTANATIGPDTIAKILFTSGSTGVPKGVINTQRMLCSNLQMILQALRFLESEPPVIVDWLPWHHTFGGNHNFGMMLFHGGTLYIDEGKPMPAGIGETIRNLREIAPTIYFNVPKGYEELVRFLREDSALRSIFFSRLKILFYAGASLPQPVWDALEELAVAAVGERIPMITGLGCTETAPSAMFAHWPGGRSGLLGVPVPGVELKLVPSGDKLEARFRGPNVTPGYWRAPELTRAAFDEEGFYRTGDALRFADPARPQEGLLFDGRISEDFKLSTGTWVSVGRLRETVLTARSPVVQDVVIAGHDRDFISAIIFPSLDGCRRLCGDGGDAASLAAHPAVRGEVRRLLERLRRDSTGSANRILRAIIAESAPSLDAGEMTDKGSLNQRTVLRHRADLVDTLYAAPPGPLVVALDDA
jgi:feruloyl-CoA synthase